MKIRKLGVCFVVAMLMVSFVFVGAEIQVYAAQIHDQLLEPESGWKRIDDTDALILYTGTWTTWKESTQYNDILHHIPVGAVQKDIYDSKVNFKFYGSKLRIIASRWPEHTETLALKIDGEEVQTANIKGERLKQILVFSVENLNLNIHSVEIYSKTPGRWDFDAIDIDENGELLDMNTPNIPVNLTATSGDEKVILSCDEVKGADKYIVKRSTKKGGPYEKIGETKETSYTDSGLDNGTTYYYVVCTVKNGATSPNSNEVSATPGGSSSSGDNALLRITMLNGTINEYDLSMSDVEDFIDWFEDRDDPYYIIKKDYNIGPFESRKDYIIADKILQFEVMEYND
ncbi:MAG: hypothetical protein N4A68_09290 [Maledivibacter sp.]|jgi:hypothetical protein|nr:hypothetical protein [Maledivibacter sp.]